MQVCGPEHSWFCMGITEALKKCCTDGFGKTCLMQGTVTNGRKFFSPWFISPLEQGYPNGVFWDQPCLPGALPIFYHASQGEFLPSVHGPGTVCLLHWRHGRSCPKRLEERAEMWLEGLVTRCKLAWLFQTSRLGIALLWLGMGPTCFSELRAAFGGAFLTRGRELPDGFPTFCAVYFSRSETSLQSLWVFCSWRVAM